MTDTIMFQFAVIGVMTDEQVDEVMSAIIAEKMMFGVAGMEMESDEFGTV